MLMFKGMTVMVIMCRNTNSSGRVLDLHGLHVAEALQSLGDFIQNARKVRNTTMTIMVMAIIIILITVSSRSSVGATSLSGVLLYYG